MCAAGERHIASSSLRNRSAILQCGVHCSANLFSIFFFLHIILDTQYSSDECFILDKYSLNWERKVNIHAASAKSIRTKDIFKR